MAGQTQQVLAPTSARFARGFVDAVSGGTTTTIMDFRTLRFIFYGLQELCCAYCTEPVWYRATNLPAREEPVYTRLMLYRTPANVDKTRSEIVFTKIEGLLA